MLGAMDNRRLSTKNKSSFLKQMNNNEGNDDSNYNDNGVQTSKVSNRSDVSILLNPSREREISLRQKLLERGNVGDFGQQRHQHQRQIQLIETGEYYLIIIKIFKIDRLVGLVVSMSDY